MSFWDNVKKMAQPYGDDEYDDYDEEEEYFDDYEEPEERPARRSSRRTPAPDPAPAENHEEEDNDEDGLSATTSFNFSGFDSDSKPAPAATGFRGSIVGGSSSNKQEVVLFRPGTFNDTSKAADDLRNRRAVIVNMENVDKDMARRVVDFLSGCVYALDGNVKKIAKSAYLFCPHNMDIVGDLETLQAEAESYV